MIIFIDYDDASENRLSSLWTQTQGSWSHSTDHYTAGNTSSDTDRLHSDLESDSILGIKATAADVNETGSGNKSLLGFGDGDGDNSASAEIVSNGYMMTFSASSDSISLRRVDNDSFTTLESYEQSLSFGTYYDFELYRDGDDIVVKFEGSEIIRVEDTTHQPSATTRIVCGARGGTSNASRIRVKNIFYGIEEVTISPSLMMGGGF